MCDPVTIGTAVVGLAASQALAPKAPDMPAVTPASQAPQSQAARMPDQQAVRRAQGGAGGAAAASSPTGTMLTGPGGVAPGALSLGRSTLLGA